MSKEFPLIVLVHSPLVGPYTWAEVENCLISQGNHVIVPPLELSLKPTTTYWKMFAEAVNKKLVDRSSPRSIVLVGHSAAGAYLPAIRQSLDHSVLAYIFVDSRLPKDNKSLIEESSEQFSNLINELTTGEMLPPWSKWFGQDVLEKILPNNKTRKNFIKELRSIPLSLFEEPIPVFKDWPDAPCGFIKLSDSYQKEAETSLDAGWNVKDVKANHLYMLTNPIKLTNIVLDLIMELIS